MSVTFGVLVASTYITQSTTILFRTFLFGSGSASATWVSTGMVLSNV